MFDFQRTWSFAKQFKAHPTALFRQLGKNVLRPSGLAVGVGALWVAAWHQFTPEKTFAGCDAVGAVGSLSGATGAMPRGSASLEFKEKSLSFRLVHCFGLRTFGNRSAFLPLVDMSMLEMFVLR